MNAFRRTASARGPLALFALIAASPQTAHAAGVKSARDWLARVPSEIYDTADRYADPLRAAYYEQLAETPWLKAFDAFVLERDGIYALIGLAFACVLVGVIARRGRRTGSLTLRLIFPDTVEGQFDVAMYRKAGKANGRGHSGKPAESRTGVRRETQFDRVMPGKWFITIGGRLEAPASGARLAWVDEEIEVEIDSQNGTIIDHTLPAALAPIEFKVHWDRQPASDVGIRLSERPETLRYSGHGNLKSLLALGDYQFVIGAGDRVIEQSVHVENYEPSLIQVDLAAPERLIFRGCPPAVAPFLQGDLGDAARALERDDQSEVASLLRARLHQSQGQTERAAEQLENAGRSREAAELRRSISDFDRAAALFEGAGDLRPAAEMWDAAGDSQKAAAAYAALEDWPEAARCFAAAGDQTGLIGALEAQGELIRAADLAAELGDRARSIRLLQQIGPQDRAFGTASERLALAFEHEGHLDLAANQLERRLAALAPGEMLPKVEFHLAELLEETGEYARAISVLQSLREQDPTYPEVGAKIENLRKQLSMPPLGGGANLRETLSAPPAGATAFVAEERYEILEEVGRGGMGLVYKARDRRLNRVIALKRMPENLRDHPGAVQLFLGEAQAAARMNHPNIVTLYDADQESGAFFITMELLEGLPLNEILAKRRRFGPRDAARLGLQVCAGLEYAHAQGIVHRDIKTANLFITRERVLKIMDFGLAKILEAVRDKGATLIAGTPYYMAPEQTAGRVTDGRTDLYSLGVTLFELSTGRLPFSEGDVPDQHRNQPVPDPGERVPDYPPALASLIHRLMAKDPEGRPASAGEVAEALSSIIAGN
ncbi:MAG: protein kinase [Myxococcota bacterium]